MADSPQGDDPEQDDKEDGASEKKILELARARFKLAAEAEESIRKEAIDDLKFSVGEQWPDDLKRQREQDSRPCLVINRLPGAIRQVTNDQRQNRPAIKVNPIDDKGDVDTAEIIQGIVRHIEYNSNADFAYDTAMDFAVRGSFGYFRIITDYSDPTSFDQELLIKQIPNPLRVYKDPSSREPDGSDSNYYFITEDLTKEDYKEQYPKSKMASMTDFASIGDSMPDWMPSGSIRVAEYFYREFHDVELALLSDGSIGPLDKLPKGADGQVTLPDGLRLVKTRMARVPVIKWCKHNAVEILESKETVFSQWIPVIPVYGEQLDIDGKLRLAGLVRDAKDPQRMANYWASCETEAIALAPKAPFIGAEGQFEGHEAEWETANQKNQPFLQYKPTSIAGIPLPPPQRQTFEPAVQAITQARAQSNEDIKYMTGVFDATMGNRSNEISGVAIQRRNSQAQTSNFHFSDNLHRSLRHAGRILVDAIPRVYDAARAVRIIGADDQQKVVLINQHFEEDGKPVIYDLAAGRYDVAIDSGPSFATKRQEAVASMLDLARSLPQVMQGAADILVQSMDWPMAKEVAGRLRKMLPPQLQDDPENKNPLPPQVQQQMSAQQQMIQQLSQQLHVAQDEIDKRRLEIDSKERIANRRAEVDLEIALAQMKADGAAELLKVQIAELEGRATRVHDAITQDAAHAQSLEAAQHANSLSPPAGSPGADAGDAPTGGQTPGTSGSNP